MRSWLTRLFASRAGLILTGGTIGLLAVLLEKLGNPSGTGLCIACFERDIAGALGLHQTEGGQYIRPEIIGLVLGSSLSALLFGEFKARGGSSPLIRFFLGAFAMIGALTFMGCPIGVILRLAGGNLNALLALSGLVAGIAIGVGFIRSGFDLGGKQTLPPINAWLMPLFMLVLLFIFLADLRVNDAAALFRSWVEPSSLSAPVGVALFAGLIAGFLAQRTRFCVIGAVRDLMLIKYADFLWGIAAMAVTAGAGYYLSGQFARAGTALKVFTVGTEAAAGLDQYAWGLLASVLTGLAFTLGGGCAGRQLFLSGEGDTDATVFIFGMFSGAAFVHNFSLIDRPACGTVGGIQTLGGAVVLFGLAFCIVTGFAMRRRWEVD